MEPELTQERSAEPSHYEEELVRAIQGGELERYAIVIQRYQQRLYVYCYHLLMQREEAEDAVQDIFIKGYEKLLQYTYNQSFSAWLYKIAYHHCLNMLKKRNRAVWVERLLGPLRQNSEDDGYATVRRREVRLQSALALQRLTAEERSLLVLKVIEGRSYDEIEQYFDYSHVALRKKVERAKTKLKRIWSELDEEGYGNEGKECFERSAESDFIRRAVASD